MFFLPVVKMQNNVNTLRARWRSPEAQKLIAVLLTPAVTKETSIAALDEFFGKDKWAITTPVAGGPYLTTDLRGLDLAGRDLRGLHFSDDLSYGDFSFCNLNGVSFNMAKLYFTNFEGSRATEKRVQLTPCYAQGAIFRNVHFKGALFTHADLRRANFSDAILENCEFNSADLTDAIFGGAQFRNCSFGSTRLSKQERDSEWFRNGAICDEEFPPVFV
jgi:uncharacterized protein YjbI with pentapeptide repeats